MTLFPSLAKTVQTLLPNNLSPERREVLQPLIDYIQSRRAQGEEVHLNFICTHNSRRSQLSQIWAQTAAYHYGIEASCYSGGVEVTAFNERAVRSIERFGFRVSSTGTDNPIYSVAFSEEAAPVTAFSKVYDDTVNPARGFAAVMTCSHADENCPFIPGAERIAVRYEDPKAFDDTPQEAARYDERSLQIANEMFFVFSQIKK